jgi:hypothetical protein
MSRISISCESRGILKEVGETLEIADGGAAWRCSLRVALLDEAMLADGGTAGGEISKKGAPSILLVAAGPSLRSEDTEYPECFLLSRVLTVLLGRRDLLASPVWAWRTLKYLLATTVLQYVVQYRKRRPEPAQTG